MSGPLWHSVGASRQRMYRLLQRSLPFPAASSSSTNNGARGAVMRRAPGRLCPASARMRHSRHWQSGLTIVEVMVSLLLGALVVLVASALLVTTNSGFLAHSASAQLNDSGRYALEIISQAIRQSAYVEWDSAAAPVGQEEDSSANIGGLDAHSISRDGDGIASPLPYVANGSDVLATSGNGDDAVAVAADAVR